MSNILFQRLNQDQLDLLNKALDNMNNKYEIIDENIPKRNSNVSRSGIVQYTLDSNVEILKNLQLPPQPLKKKRIEINYNLNDFPWSYQSHRNKHKDKDNKKLYEIYLPYYSNFGKPFTIPMRIYKQHCKAQSIITMSSNDNVYYIEISIEKATLVYSPVYLPTHINIHKAFIEIGNYLIQSRILQDEIIFIIKQNINFLNVSISEVCTKSNIIKGIDVSNSPMSVVSYNSQTNSSNISSYDTSNYLSASHLHDVFKGWIKFCCNIDIRLWTKYLSILYTCIPSWMMCKSQSDILRHLRQDVEGMTTPQVYIKVPGVWTGGHEENNRFRSVNCNNGPGISEWYAVEHKYLSKIRSLVLKSYNVDILYKEGHWYPSIEFLESNEIPYMYGLQYPGDVILLKGQTLHWVRSLGFSVHFSWNFGYLEYEQILTSLDRYYINDLLTLNGNSFQNLVPMKTLILDIVYDVIAYGQMNNIQINNNYTINRIINKNEIQSLLNDPLLLLRLIIELSTNVIDVTQRLQEYSQLTGLIPKQEEENSIVVYCSCNREIFECYLLSKCCKYMCLHCLSNQTCKFNNQYIHELESQLLYKTNPSNLQELLDQFIEYVKTIHPNLINDIDSSISYIKSRSSYFTINRYKRLSIK
uniref:JmjC domain-containing protein n=1 Tax=Chromulina nebulosa TaxID=96789 RepID=A0A7S0XBB1_9STRA